jgi:hypothetical protein
VLYLWRYAVRHDIIYYEVGPVTGTSKISQQHFANVVRSAADEWNNAAGKTVLWNVPLGRHFHVSLSADGDPIKGYWADLAGLEKEASEVEAAREAKSSEMRAYSSLHPTVFDAAGNFNEASPFWPTYYELLLSRMALLARSTNLRDRIQAAMERISLKDTYIREAPLASGGSGTSVSITAYVDDADLRALLLHAFGHALGLTHSPGVDAMSATGRSTTITQDLAAEASAGH